MENSDMGSQDEGRFMVAVGALIENSKNGKILLLKRSDKLDFAGLLGENRGRNNNYFT